MRIVFIDVLVIILGCMLRLLSVFSIGMCVKVFVVFLLSVRLNLFVCVCVCLFVEVLVWVLLICDVVISVFLVVIVFVKNFWCFMIGIVFVVGLGNWVIYW